MGYSGRVRVRLRLRSGQRNLGYAAGASQETEEVTSMGLKERLRKLKKDWEEAQVKVGADKMRYRCPFPRCPLPEEKRWFDTRPKLDAHVVSVHGGKWEKKW